MTTESPSYSTIEQAFSLGNGQDSALNWLRKNRSQVAIFLVSGIKLEGTISVCAPLSSNCLMRATSWSGVRTTARTSDPHSATAQFFINVADNDFLNFKAPNANGWGYCVFGKVVDGSDVVDKIKAVKTGSSGFHQDVPKEDVIIERAEVC